MTFISVNCLINTLSTDVSVRTLCIHQLERVLYGGCYLRRALLESSQQQGMSEKEKRKKNSQRTSAALLITTERTRIFSEKSTASPPTNTHTAVHLLLLLAQVRQIPRCLIKNHSLFSSVLFKIVMTRGRVQQAKTENRLKS